MVTKEIIGEKNGEDLGMYKACAESNNLINNEVKMVKNLKKILMAFEAVCGGRS